MFIMLKFTGEIRDLYACMNNEDDGAEVTHFKE